MQHDKSVIRFGSRKSELALIQTRLVMDAVRRAHPGLQTEIVPMDTTGDRNMKPFSEASDRFGIKGLFTQELEEALLSGAIDAAVHSLKDMPAYINPELPLVAFSKREDPRDVLVLPEGVCTPKRGGVIGCSSARRRIQLRELFPDMRIEPVRGNVNTRLRKLGEGQYDALVLAAAGLKRLGLEYRAGRYFEPDEMVPAPGQGIMVCQGRAGADYSYLNGFRDPRAETCARAERVFSAALGGGCTAPVGAFAEINNGRMEMTGFFADEERNAIGRGSISGPAEMAAELALELVHIVKKEVVHDLV